MTKKRLESWKVSDELWKRVEPLIPPPERDPKKRYTRKIG
jgi:transposase